MKAERAIQILEVEKQAYREDVHEDFNRALQMAIDALDKAEPMRTGELEIDEDGRPVIPCGNCGEALEYGLWSYCPWCGQKIKWGKLK